jgi:excisionase family DNA binding protein
MATQTGSRRNQPPAQLFSVPAAAARLECSEMHIYRLVSTGELRAVDISLKGAGKSKTRIRSDDLDAYIEARTRRTGETPDDPQAPQPSPRRRAAPPGRSSPSGRIRAKAALDPSPAA